MSDLTKKAIIDETINLGKDMNVDKINVSMICEKLDISRKTFYYHFIDINDLLETIYKVLINKLVGSNYTIKNWQDGYKEIFKFIHENQKLVKNTFYSNKRSLLDKYLYKVCESYIVPMIKKENEIIDLKMLILMSDFIKYALCGFVFNYIESNFKVDYNILVKDIHILLDGSIKNMINNINIKKNT